MSTRYIVIGAGGHAAVLVDALLASGSEVLGLTDADPARQGSEVCGRSVLGDDSALARFDSRDVSLANGVGAVGDCTLRRQVQARLESSGWKFATVRHPSAVVSQFARVGVGAQLLAGCVVQPRASVAKGCIVNTRAVVEHDVTLGEFTHVAPGAVICGDVRVGAFCHVGAGAVIRQGISIGDGTVMGAGAVIVDHHPGGGVLIGVPARARRDVR
jgi:sugar O-acyltransferase (sialic acid O-acetyltransferase NeuD family)